MVIQMYHHYYLQGFYGILGQGMDRKNNVELCMKIQKNFLLHAVTSGMSIHLTVYI